MYNHRIRSKLTKAVLKREYIDNLMSAIAIAEKYETNKALVLRLLREYQIPIRNQSESARVSLASQRRKHPTKDIGHTEETKEKIRKAALERHNSKNE